MTGSCIFSTNRLNKLGLLGLISISALFEELVFRVILLNALPGGTVLFRAASSALLFALAHIPSACLHRCEPHSVHKKAAQLVYAFAAGCIFAALTILSGSLFPAIVLHIASNVFMICIGSDHLMLYIDPGTGFMLFTVIPSIISAAVYSIRLFVIKMRSRVGGKGRVDAEKQPFVIFSDNKRYWNVFEPICRRMQERGLSVLYLTASEDDPVFSCGLSNIRAEFIGEGNQMFNRLNNLNAYIVLSTTPGLEVYQWKRSPKVSWYVHIPHAASEVILYRMFGIDYYDAVLLSGQYQADDIRALEALRKLPAKELRMIGIPYMDEMAARLERNGKVPEHPRTVLLAPSWGKSALFSVYGGRIIEELLKTGYHVIVRPHPQSFLSETERMDRLMKEYPGSADLEWNRDRDNFDVLNRSDILISDFSGVIFDFTLVYDKPVIYTDPDFDLAPYDAWWLQKELWTATALPRLGRRLTEEGMNDIKSLIDECIEDPRYTEGRRQVKDETWQHFGQGAGLAADYLVSKYEELKEGDEKH